MKHNIKIKILLGIFASLLFFGCSPKSNNIDFDFTTLKKSKNNKGINKENISKINLENNIPLKDLVPLKDKQEILSKTKFGKKDPFSERKIQKNKLNTDFN